MYWSVVVCLSVGTMVFIRKINTLHTKLSFLAPWNLLFRGKFLKLITTFILWQGWLCLNFRTIGQTEETFYHCLFTNWLVACGHFWLVKYRTTGVNNFVIIYFIKSMYNTRNNSILTFSNTPIKFLIHTFLLWQKLTLPLARWAKNLIIRYIGCNCMPYFQPLILM
jgi:hypothetical protein